MIVESYRLFHVTRDVVQNHHAPLVPGQAFACGQMHNPFFGFYERPRTYPVNIENRVENVPAINFLRRVHDGSITPHNLPKDALEIAQHYVMLCRELILDEVREKHFSDLPSRKTCLWAAEDQETARHWARRLGDGQNIRILDLRVSGRLHRADANHILGDSEPLSETYRKAHAYWRGEQSQRPEMEVLFSGVAEVVSVIAV